MRNPLLIVALLVTSHAALVGVATARHRLGLHPESARKLLHMLLGSVLCTLPWLFTDSWPVVALCAAYVTLLIAARYWSWLTEQVSGVMYAVGRRSAGDIFFPLAVAFLFLTTRHDRPAYLCAMLILTFADAAAAVVGTRYGLSTYASPAGRKSLEGSTAFAVVAFAATHLSLLLLDETGRAQSVIIALAVALVLTLAEAISFAGLDNLLVPTLAIALLNWMRPMPLNQLTLLAVGALFALIASAAVPPLLRNRSVAPVES
jgi:phytol kinase